MEGGGAVTRSRRRFGDYLQALSAVGLPDGNTLSVDERWARKLFDQRVSLDEVADMALVTDPEGKPYLPDDADLYFMLHARAAPQDVEEMLSISDEWGNRLDFDPCELSSFLGNGGTREFAEQLFCLTNSEGMPIFDGKAISDFRHYGGTVEYAQEIASIADTEGNMVFSEGDMIAIYRYLYKDMSLARSLVGLRDSDGRSVFRDGEDIVSWLYHQGSLEQVESYLSIADTDGRAAFNGHDIALLQQHSVPPVYAAAMAAQGMNALTAIYYYRIGFAPEDIGFARDGRPRALLLYPTFDSFYLGNSAFSSSDSFGFIRRVGLAYDIRLRAISTVSEMCREIEATPDVRLLMLGGHGRRDALCFGESMPNYGIRIPERDRMLRTSSKEAANYFSMLPARATIFLYSCSNGEGRETGKNLANRVAEWAPGRRVISSANPIGPYGLEVESYSPLELRIIGDKDAEGKDTDSMYMARKAVERGASGKRKRR